MRTVTLILPGYAIDTSFATIQSTTPRPVSLQGYRFSEKNALRPWQADLATELNIETDEGLYLPSAAIETLRSSKVSPAVSADQSFQGLVRADPVFLKADKDNATLIAPNQLGLTDSEADSILATLNDLVRDDGMSFFRAGAAQWYLAGQSAKELRSYPPSFLANRKASSFLPDGVAAREWRRLMTEVQMLLHTHPVNLQREQRKKMPVNSVWFWGGAPMPKAIESSMLTHVYSDMEEARQLASAAQVQSFDLSAFSEAIQHRMHAEQSLVIDTSLLQAWLNTDIDALQERLSVINEQWLLPLEKMVAQGQLCRVDVLGEDGLRGRCTADTLKQSKISTSSQASKPWWNYMKRLFS